MSNLSDNQITDVVIRSQMHREIIAAIKSSKTNLLTREIKVDEAYREDLVSFRIYQRDELGWLVDLIAAREDRNKPLPVGKTFKYPTLTYIRDTLRKYATFNTP